MTGQARWSLRQERPDLGSWILMRDGVEAGMLSLLDGPGGLPAWESALAVVEALNRRERERAA